MFPYVFYKDLEAFMTFFEVLQIHIKKTKHVENYFHVENIKNITLVVLLLTLNMLLSVG